MAELTVIEPAPGNTRLPSGRACASCGAPVEPLDRFCAGCGAPNPAAVVLAETVVEQKHFQCKNCGAEVAVDPQQRSYVCAFCDSTVVVEFSPDATGRQPPEFVIGFAVTPEQALAKFKSWLADGGWFRPGDLKSAQIAGKLRGVYLPFWSFSMLAESQWGANIGEHWWETQSYTTWENGKMVTKTRRVQHTEWWPLTGRHHRYYSGYLVSGSRGLPQREADRVKPFHLGSLKRYDPRYLAGWLSEEYSIARDKALELCEEEFRQQERKNIAAFMPGDTHRELMVMTHFSQAASDLVLLPVYVLAYRHRDKLYRFMVNGQTGRVAGDKPLSWARIAAAIALGAIAAIALIWLFSR